MKLTLQKIAIQASPKHVIIKKSIINSSLVRLISGERLQEEPINLRTMPHAVMYLTLDGSSDGSKDKVIVMMESYLNIIIVCVNLRYCLHCNETCLT